MKPLATANAAGISFEVFIAFGYRHGSKIVHPPDLIRPQSSDFWILGKEEIPMNTKLAVLAQVPSIERTR